MTKEQHAFNDLVGVYYEPHDGVPGYRAVCNCGYACKARPSAEAARAAVEAHVAKAAR